ncbi:hypothetical protein ACX4MY_00025 [Roseomonas mucosa]|uniref:hypothetical protein n=1 Tax=Roseomonas mucosa TaxID=207340 RepID=UPI001DB36ECF|nr:hypothetical protein [Roseomonas mucosa]MBS5905142.1 hypothetical protein [Acetobacteraceae bacterium]MDT8352427.1 hypothetical protein [Roseomonas mucosa]
MRVMIDLPDELAAWLDFWQRPEIPMDAPLRRKVLAVLQEAHDDHYARLDVEADAMAAPSSGPSKDDDLPF